MWRALALAAVGACSFEPGKLPAAPDVFLPPPPDSIEVTWTVDASSGRGVPASAAEWSQLLHAYTIPAVPPTHLWLAQETAGALEDALGSVSLVPQNNPTYANVVPGWSRLGAGTVTTAGNQGFISNAVGNLDGRAYLLLAYVSVQVTPPNERSLLGIGAGPDHRYTAIAPSGSLRATGAGVVPTTGVHPISDVQPILISIRPSRSQYSVYSNLEKLETTWRPTSGSGPLLMLGNAIIGAVAARYLYAALWVGDDAELDEQTVLAMLRALGWSVDY